jgi:hypothetical protein
MLMIISYFREYPDMVAKHGPDRCLTLFASSVLFLLLRLSGGLGYLGVWNFFLLFLSGVFALLLSIRLASSSLFFF